MGNLSKKNKMHIFGHKNFSPTKKIHCCIFRNIWFFFYWKFNFVKSAKRFLVVHANMIMNKLNGKNINNILGKTDNKMAYPSIITKILKKFKFLQLI